MVRNKLAAAILGASLLLPGVVSALGVGDYTLKSYLNQPLKLEIGLIQTKDLAPEDIAVGLASPQDYEKAGIEYVYFLQDLQFEVQPRADGGMDVLVSSRKAVTEPFLNFLLQVQWPDGRAMREYTILLDPPVYKTGDAPTATEQAVTEQPAEQAPVAATGETAAAEPLPEPVVTGAPPPLVMSDGSTFEEGSTAGTVSSVDDSGLPPPPSAALSQEEGATASSSGSSYQPASEPAPSRPAAVEGEYKVAANDTMWEIAQRHQGTGSVQQTMLAIQRANPDAFIQGNLNLVKKGAVLRIPGEDEVGQVSRSEASAEFAAQTKAWREMLDQRAAVLPSDKATLEASAPVAAKPAKPKGTGKGEVTLVAPTASGKSGKASGDKSDEALRNDLAIVNEGIAKATRENKSLEKQLGELDKQIKSSEKQVAVKNDKIAGLQDELGRLRKEQGVEAPAVAETAPVEEPKPKKAEPKEQPVAEPVVEAPAEPASSLPLLPIIGAAVVLIGGAAFFFLRRRKPAAPAVVDSTHDDQVAEDLAQLQDLNLDVDTDEEPVDAVADAGEGSGDPLGEADMYVAYGRFQQAADILYAALQREPERADIRVKLAEVYAEMGDNDAAAEQARGAAGSSDVAIRKQAEAVLARIGGGAPAGGRAKAAAAPAPVEETLSLDDLAQEFSAGGGESTATATTAALDDLSLDFSAPVAAPAEEPEALDFSLDDVDLDLGTVEVPATPSPSSATEVRPKADFGELSFDNAGFDELSLPEEVAPAPAVAEEFSLEDEFSLDEAPALPVVEDEPDFAAVSGARPKVTDQMIEEVSAAPAPAAEVDLEAELADLETDLQGGDSTGGDDFDFLADSDENATKLDLAKAYIDMGDADGARDILGEVIAEGNATQKSEAQKLLAQVG